MRSTRQTWIGTVVGSLVLLGIAHEATPRSDAGPLEPRAGTWKPWVLTSGRELRLPPPPDARTTATELQELEALARQRNTAALEQIRHWDFRSPAHRWNEMLTDAAVASNMSPGAALRALPMLNVAIADAMVAAWDSKFAHARRRPGETDARLATAIPSPRSPSYPCEYAVAAGAGAAVLTHLFPQDAGRFADAAEEAARSRVLASVAYPSDARAGLELGRAVAARVMDAMKLDGQKWAGTVPVGPGLWQGSNPAGIDEMRWKLFVLSSVSQFRPGPPPGPDSPRRAAEIAEVKNFKRTPLTNGKAIYWQFGQYGGPGLTPASTDGPRSSGNRGSGRASTSGATSRLATSSADASDTR